MNPGAGEEGALSSPFLLGGTQHSFNLRIEEPSISMPSLKSRRSVYRELFDLESSIKHDADLPLMITDAINDVDISGEEESIIFTDADKAISDSVSMLIKQNAEIGRAHV